MLAELAILGVLLQRRDGLLEPDGGMTPTIDAEALCAWFSLTRAFEGILGGERGNTSTRRRLHIECRRPPEHALLSGYDIERGVVDERAADVPGYAMLSIGGVVDELPVAWLRIGETVS
ncbi:hypothetical protein ACQQ2N_17195 [Dokdonella sp. MW10]|uniref:hypothetical protein n=1 Tax=Dokdonella sp. MW10 TaxID=2992926 RepID=UPI003F80AF51